MNLTTLTFIAAVASAAVTVASAAVPPASVNTLGSAIVVQDQASLRAAPRDGAQQQASLWQGEVLEVRGERLDYLQVWDHKRERGGEGGRMVHDNRPLRSRPRRPANQGETQNLHPRLILTLTLTLA